MKFRRKNIRLPRPSYIGPQWYFLTACTQDRVPRFEDATLVEQTLSCLDSESETQGFAVQAYCFMPDHLHVLTNGTHAAADCLSFVKIFKQRSAYAFKQATGLRLWQHKPYDHILRPDERWEAVAYYIWMNPVRKDLCNRPQDWPFSGSRTVDWRRLLTPPAELWVPPWKNPARVNL
jgi:REP-associated tyrosine transposase